MANTILLARVVREFEPDIVHSFARLAYLLPVLRSAMPLIMSYQRMPTRRTVQIGSRLAKRHVLSFTGCSEFIAREGRSIGGVWDAVPNFVDPGELEFRPSVPEDSPLVFLSRVESIKGAHLAIEIARRAGRRLIIAGNHADAGPEWEYWTSHVAPHLGRDGLEYVGPVNDMQKSSLLAGALAMVVPIQWEEPFGIVFVEALACGTPVISCPRGALPEIVRDGVEGFLVRNVEQALLAVERLPSISRSACRDRVLSAFSADVVVGQYLDLYARRQRALH